MSGINIFIKEIVENYINGKSWRISENANTSWGYPSLLGHISSGILSDYALNEVYTPEIKKVHKEHSIHLHDLSGGGLIFYCMGHSLKQLLLKGFGGITNKIEAKPAKHFDSILGQMVSFIGTLQSENSGAQAFSSVSTYLAPFIRYDNLTEERVKQQLQQFLFGLNQTSRWGGECPFSNITIDLKCPEPLKNTKIIIGGKEQKETYGEFQKEIDLFNKTLVDLLIEGDSSKKPFTFPLITVNLTKDFDWDNEIAQKIFFLTSKYGTPTFQNFFSGELDPSQTYSLCCRLRINLKELENKQGGLFGAKEHSGSIGVVTINMPQLGYKTKGNKEKFFSELKRLMDLSSESLEIKRQRIEKSLKDGLLPWTKEYIGDSSNHFSTIGLVGMHECCQNFLGKSNGIDTKDGKDFTLEVLTFMRDIIKKYQEKTKRLYNLEATPAEGTSHRLARYDKKNYKDIITSGKEGEEYYTNSVSLPVNYNGDIFDVLKHQDELLCKFNGGSIFHTFVGERIYDWRTTRNLVRKIVENFKLPYFTITPTFSICPTHNYISGEHHRCPIDGCNNNCDVYSRVVGYYRPVKQWNTGKKSEFKNRKSFAIE